MDDCEQNPIPSGTETPCQENSHGPSSHQSLTAASMTIGSNETHNNMVYFGSESSFNMAGTDPSNFAMSADGVSDDEDNSMIQGTLI